MKLDQINLFATEHYQTNNILKILLYNLVLKHLKSLLSPTIQLFTIEIVHSGLKTKNSNRIFKVKMLNYRKRSNIWFTNIIKVKFIYKK